MGELYEYSLPRFGDAIRVTFGASIGITGEIYMSKTPANDSDQINQLNELMRTMNLRISARKLYSDDVERTRNGKTTGNSFS